MTTARQERKQYRTLSAVFATFGLALLSLSAGAPLAGAGTTERLVVDWHTGLAIAGYDPIAYFTEGKPMPGSAELELSYGGAVWRFRNSGNRDAFARHPDVYMPQFGGYDPLGVAHGVAVPGNPMLWRISGDRLFLFYDQGRLDAFDVDPARMTVAAGRKWPDVLRTLSR